MEAFLKPHPVVFGLSMTPMYIPNETTPPDCWKLRYEPEEPKLRPLQELGERMTDEDFTLKLGTYAHTYTPR